MASSWAGGIALLIAALIAPTPVRGDDAAGGFAAIRPALVKVWAFDAHGHPRASGSGIVIVSNAHRSLVLTAAHVVDGAASLRVDVDRRRHDIDATVDARGGHDLALLTLDRGDLTPATFAPRSRRVAAGNVVAIAGYVEHDELIGVVGQGPRVLFPATVAARPGAGAYLELENVAVEAGLSGGPVFDPRSGDVLGIVTSRTADRSGGFADAVPDVVLPFLDARRVAYRVRPAVVAAASPRTPVPSPLPTLPAPAPAVLPPATPTMLPAAVATTMPAPAAPSPTPLLLVPLASPAPPGTPPSAAPLDLANDDRPSADDGPSGWRLARPVQAQIPFTRGNCAALVTVTVSRFSFGPDDGRSPEAPAHPQLALDVTVAPTASDDEADGCDTVRAHVEAEYDPVAASYESGRLIVRFVLSTPSSDLLPNDAGVDARLDGDRADAQLQLFGQAWDGTLTLPLTRS